MKEEPIIDQILNNPMVGYLISHESHHRGSMMMALMQHGMKMKQDAAIRNIWGKWMWGER